jgi:hypothetical protein
VKRALRVAGVTVSGKSYLGPLTPVWADLSECIPDSYSRECLRRFLRFLSAMGIAPNDVDDAAVEAFRLALIREGITDKPYTATQSAVRLWNRMIERVPGWPQRRLTPLRRGEFYTVIWSSVRPELVEQVDTYLALLGGADPTDDRAPPRRLKKRSLAKRRYELLQFMSALHHKGVPLAELHSLEDLCKPEYLKLALRFFCDRHRKKHGNDSDATESTMIGGIADAIRILAKHYVQTPPDVLRELTRLTNRFQRRSHGMSEKNRQRLASLNLDALMSRFSDAACPHAMVRPVSRGPQALAAAGKATRPALDLDPEHADAGQLDLLPGRRDHDPPRRARSQPAWLSRLHGHLHRGASARGRAPVPMPS